MYSRRSPPSFGVNVAAMSLREWTMVVMETKKFFELHFIKVQILTMDDLYAL